MRRNRLDRALGASSRRADAARVRGDLGRIAGTPITAAMVFTAVGLLVGSEALGLVELAPAGETVKHLAEATPHLVLFADASRIDARYAESSRFRPVCSGSACR